jgi:hypothetical protein
MEMIVMINQKVQDELKKFQDNKNKNLQTTQTKLNDLREDFNKHHDEMKDSKKKSMK